MAPARSTDKTARAAGSRDRLYGLAAVFFVAIISVALTMQGWASRIPAFDDLTYMYDAHNFLQSGTLARYGDTDSYGSYSAPGTAWLMLPGLVLFRDPRLFEYPGAALLHIATLFGLFLLARRFFGVWCACLTVLLYGLSANALFFAGSLWPIARPDFYVLAVLMACWWVLKKDARCLAASLAIWGLGMYVDMAVLPLFFIYPVLWLYYRPPLRFAPLLVAALIVLLVWSPYLNFEVPRRFADIRSQLLQQSVMPAHPRKTWCDTGLTLSTWQDPSAAAQASPLVTGPGSPGLLSRLSDLWENLLSNFQSLAPLPGADIGLIFLTFVSLLALSLPGSADQGPNSTVGPPFWRRPAMRVSLGLALMGVLLGALVLAYQLGRDGAPVAARFLFLGKLSRIMFWSGLALLVAPWIVMVANRLLVRLGWQIQTPEQAEENRMLAFSLLVPWFILLLFSEPGKPERFLWLWPLQVLFLVAFFTNVLPRLGIDRRLIWIGAAALLLIVIGNSFLLDRSTSWIRTGWAGTDATEAQVVGEISRQVKADGKTQAAIGYEMFIYPFMAEYNITNPRYKVGAEFDLLFRFKYGITNLDQCAEGLAAQDEYRVVETRPKPPDWSPKEYFLVARDADYQLVGQFGTYQIYRRNSSLDSGESPEN